MTLPNPFLNVSVPVTNPAALTGTSKFKQELNPGPGLPQSQISNYKYVPRSQLHHKFRNSNNYTAQYLPFSCDRCDRGFKSQEQLDAHIAEHVPCGIDGCKFVAHPKIVEKHIMMQHETGLAEQIMRLNTPEEIEKWREQRKKNFPSAQNIARRQAAQKEKLERGEVLYDSKSRFGKNTKGKGNQKGKQFQQNNRNNNQRVAASSQAPKKDTPAAVVKPNPEPVKTIAVTKVKTDNYLSEGEIESDTEMIPQIASANALTSLLGCYGSDSDEAGTSEPPAKVAKIEEVKQPVLNETNNKPPAKKQPKKAKKKNPKAGPPQAKQYGPKQLTLLQKLLQGEIRHERNVILQCVHYIVQQGFFSQDSSLKSDPSEPSLDTAENNKAEETEPGRSEC